MKLRAAVLLSGEGGGLPIITFQQVKPTSVPRPNPLWMGVLERTFRRPHAGGANSSSRILDALPQSVSEAVDYTRFPSEAQPHSPILGRLAFQTVTTLQRRSRTSSKAQGFFHRLLLKAGRREGAGNPGTSMMRVFCQLLCG